MFRRCSFVIALGLAAHAIGCGSPVEERQIEVKTATDPMLLPKSVLQQYAAGQPLGSEVTSFPGMVEEVRKADPAKADILEKGLQEIEQASPAGRPAKAKSLLQKL